MFYALKLSFKYFSVEVYIGKDVTHDEGVSGMKTDICWFDYVSIGAAYFLFKIKTLVCF